MSRPNYLPRPVPALPLEVLAHIVDLHANDSITEGGYFTPQFITLLSTSVWLRDCAMRNLCREIIIDCSSPARIHKLLEVLTPSTTAAWRLGSVVPYIKTITLLLSHFTESREALKEFFTVVDILSTQSRAHNLMLDGACHSTLPGDCHDCHGSQAMYSLHPIAVQKINQLMQMPTLSGLQVYAVPGIDAVLGLRRRTLLNLSGASGMGPSSKTDSGGTVNKYNFRKLVFKFCGLPFSMVIPDVRSIVVESVTPYELRNAWQFCLRSRETLESLTINNEYNINTYTDVDSDDDEDGPPDGPLLLQRSIRIDKFPRLKYFKYTSVLHNPEMLERHVPTVFPQIMFFAPEAPSSTLTPMPLQHLSLTVAWGNVFKSEFAAESKEQAVGRMADPAWGILDCILTLKGCFPCLRHVDLTLSQEVQLGEEELVLDAKGRPCRKATAESLQGQISESLQPSFSKLRKHPLISFKLNIIVTVEEPDSEDSEGSDDL